MAADPRHLHRLERVRRGVARFAAVNYQQKQLRTTLLTIIAYLERLHLQGSEPAELARWWRVVTEYRRALESPRLAGKGRRRALKRLLDEE